MVCITDIAAWCNIEFDDAYSNPLYYAGNLYVNNELLVELKIPETVTDIKTYAFSCCNITSVVIGDGVKSICDYAFAQCNKLTNVVLGDSVTMIYDDAFLNCKKLQYNEYANAKYLGSINNPYFALIKVKNENYSSYEIHADTKIIADYGFSRCSNLQSIVIPDGVTTIGSAAFWGCTSLTSVSISNSVTTIGGFAFAGCYLTSVSIPDSVTTIGDSAFEGCMRLTSVIIPDSVVSIGHFAFNSCSIMRASLPAKAISYMNATYLKTVVITSGEIDAKAFYGFTDLTSVVIGDSVTSIGNDAFNECSALKDVYYKGSEEDWAKIKISTVNYNLKGATRHYNYVPEE
jgi:hypothetical protein